MQLRNNVLVIVLCILTMLVPPAGFAGTPAAQAPEARGGYGVQYTLDGVLELQEGVVTLHTGDGRVFTLLVNPKKVASWVGRTVRVEGLARQADDLDRWKVKKITPVPPDPDTKIELPPYKSFQKPPALIGRKGDTFQVANVRWDIAPGGTGKADEEPAYGWRTATIRPDRVKNVYFVKKPFPPEWIAAHSLMVFTFDKGGMVDETGRESSGLVLTIEAYQRTNQKYGLVEGMKRRFGVVWLLTTWDNYLEQSCHYGKGKLHLYPVRLTGDQKKQLAREAIEQAVVNREGEFYHTITNNCTNNLVILLNRVLEPARRIKLWALPSFIYNFRATMPVWVPPMLTKRGLLGPELPVVDTTTWKAPWAQNPDTYKP
ncbi:MAG TPA: DUF4105 domain-containing protein [Candidatus Ozemobacteraceae bacterium]|nr:DUF4105 domain-containing protein [Candidatus Ozemobacteraceae bacterium]